MTKKREHRQAKNQEKKRKKRDQARSTRGSRRIPGSSASDNLAEAVEWPVDECYVSANWYERGAQVHAGFTRMHADGRIAAAFFEIDLAERGVLKAMAKAGLAPQNVQAELVRRSSEEVPMLTIEPELVVKMVETAAAFGVAQGHRLPAHYEGARAIFGGIRAGDSPHEILCGTEETPAPVHAPSTGLFESFKRRMGFGS